MAVKPATRGGSKPAKPSPAQQRVNAANKKAAAAQRDLKNAKANAASLKKIAAGKVPGQTVSPYVINKQVPKQLQTASKNAADQKRRARK